MMRGKGDLTTDGVANECGPHEAVSEGVSPFFQTERGAIFLHDSLDLLTNHIKPHSIDLIVTSPPFGLVRKKEYGNVDAEQYVKWFKPFGNAFFKALKPTGSLVIDIGGAWNPGLPTRNLYHYELLLMLCKEVGFHLAQEYFWWSPSKLPTPAEWVTVRRIRVKDAVDFVWWLSPTPWPRANNRRVLAPYSEAMKGLLKNGYRAKSRPSGHEISEKFSIDNGAAIPPNILAIPNTESNSYYLRYCRENGLRPHPARFPSELPEYFIRMVTDLGDVILDPFAGSCVTGEVAERLGRKWICAEVVEDYLKGALARFSKSGQTDLFQANAKKASNLECYRLFRPAILWNGQTGVDTPPLSSDGGRKRSGNGKRQ